MKIRLAIALVVCLVGTASAALQTVRSPTPAASQVLNSPTVGIEGHENVSALLALQMRPQ